jgi:hypothetical protein
MRNPYTPVGESVEARATRHGVELFLHEQRVAAHQRSRVPYRPTSNYGSLHHADRVDGGGARCSTILLKALQHGYRGLFIKAQDLFDEMYKSLADRSSRTLLDRLMRVDLLLIDEMGYLNLRPEQSNIFFKLMEERYGKKATIITTNLDYNDWYGFLGQKEMVGALLDRLRHRCHTIQIEGTSLRAPQT